MSLQVSAVPASIQNSEQDSNRRSGNFHPSVWGDHFLSYASDDSKETDGHDYVKHLELKEEIRRMLITDINKHSQKKLDLVDAIQRLGVFYHFDSEVDEILEKMAHRESALMVDEDYDLYYTSLQFRLLRQHGYKISSDVFNKFKDSDGNFKASLVGDVRGMLSLYEAAYLRVQGENILEEELAFTTCHLQSIAAQFNTPLAAQVKHALGKPIRKGLQRLEARYYLSNYQEDPSHNKVVLTFAKLDFNILQKVHQKELGVITRWWKDLDFTTKLPYARDRLVELYFWIVGVYFEPKYELGRRIMTKVIYITSIIDDTFDVYGTFEEIKLFIEAVKRWDIDAVDVLPEYMKLIYKTLLDIFSEIEDEMVKQRKSYCIPYAKKKMQELIEMYFLEAKWFNEGYVPTMEEYMEVATVSCGYVMLATISFLGMGEIATDEAFEWVSSNPNPKIVRASCVICRLMDDIVSHTFEQKRGHVASGVECYMKQHGVSEEDAVEVFQKEVENAWKDINEELLKPTAFPMPLLERVLNLARVIDYLHKHDDYYTNSHFIKDHIASLFRDPLPL